MTQTKGLWDYLVIDCGAPVEEARKILGDLARGHMILQSAGPAKAIEREVPAAQKKWAKMSNEEKEATIIGGWKRGMTMAEITKSCGGSKYSVPNFIGSRGMKRDKYFKAPKITKDVSAQDVLSALAN